MLLLLASLAQATTYTVDPSGATPGSYANFTKLPAFADGDVVHLVAGSWSALNTLESNRDITLQGDGRGTTSVDTAALSVGSAGHITVQDLSLVDTQLSVVTGAEKVTLRRVDWSNTSASNLLSETLTALEVYDSTFTGGTSALTLRADSVVLDHVTISGTSGTGASFTLSETGTLSASQLWIDGAGDGGLYVSGGASVTLQDSTFTNNSRSGDGGGISFDRQSSVTIANSHFEGNTATGSGGGLYIERGDLSLTESSFENNTADWGGGLYAAANYSFYTWEVQSLSFIGNTATGSGGGAFLDNYQATPSELSFEGNTATDDGGGLYARSMTVSDCLFSSNQAGYGGGAYGPEVQDSDFFDNTATGSGGAYVGAELSNVTIDGSSAPNGGAIHALAAGFTATGLIVSGSSATTGNGGAIFSEDLQTDIILQDSRLSGNSACGHGGAIYLDTIVDLQIQDSQIWDNQANSCGGGGDGGGLWLRSRLQGNDGIELTGLHICGNSADNAGGLYLKNAEDITLSHLALVDNTASTLGGGAWLKLVEDSTVDHSIFVGNSAGTGGGLYANSGSSVDIVNSVFAYTDAGRGLTMTSGVWAASSVSYTNFYSNLSQDVGGNSAFSTSADNNLAVDPAFSSTSDDGDCSNDAYWLSSSSAMIDAGSGSDSDGSTADLGIHGGVGAWVSDRDGDGEDYNSDCDDLNAAASSAGTEVCGGLDEDCDGSVDEGGASDALTWYLDADGDGYGDAASTQVGCSAPSGYVADDTDCDDADSAVHPGAAEVCDGLDNDCDGLLDPTDAWDVQVFRVDSDGDGHGTTALALGCSAGDGLSAMDDDCEDSNATVFPGAPETPYDGIDQDCDGADVCDVDGDGFSDPLCGGEDCDDGDPSVYVGAPETPYDGVDQDCSGSDWCDLDEDGSDALACGGTDCDDTDSSVLPGATEVPYDGVDQDCDGSDLCDVDGDGLDAADCGGTDCDDEDASVGTCDGDSPSDSGTDSDPESGCSAAGAAPSGMWLLAVLGLLLGRRRGRTDEP